MSSADTGPGFARRVARSLLYTGLGNVSTRVLGLLSLLLALRWVSLETFGLASLVLAVTAILRAVAELSLGAALVQREQVSATQTHALFWVSLVVSSAAAGLLAVAAPSLADAFDAPSLTDPLRLQVLVLPLGALALVPRARLERRLAMGRLTLVDNIGTLVGAATLVGLAAAGAGVWSFIVAELANRGTQALGAFVAEPYRPRLPQLRTYAKDGPELRELLRFGLYTSGSRLLYHLYINTDYLVIGAMLSEDQLGLYAFAYRIVLDPTRGLTNVIARVAYPTLCSLQSQPDRLLRYLASFARLSTGPIGVLVVVGAVFAEPLLLTFGYQRWLSAVPLVHLLAVLAILQTATPLIPQLLNAVGRARDNFVYSATCAVLMPIAFTVGAALLGLRGVALAWALGYPLVAIVLVLLGARAVQRSPVRLLVLMYMGAWVLLPVGAAALALRSWVDSPEMAILATIGLSIAGLGLVGWVERATVRRLRSHAPVDTLAPAAKGRQDGLPCSEASRPPVSWPPSP